MIIIILIYLIGCIVSYLYSKRSHKKDFGNYTIGDRNFNLIMALFSWASVLTVFVYDSLGNSDLYDKPAKW